MLGKNMHFLRLICLPWLMLWSTFALSAQTVDSVRLHRGPDHTRIVFDLNAPLEHKLDKLANPDRIVLDLIDVDLNFDVARLEYSDSPITNIRCIRSQ